MASHAGTTSSVHSPVREGARHMSGAARSQCWTALSSELRAILAGGASGGARCSKTWGSMIMRAGVGLGAGPPVNDFEEVLAATDRQLPARVPYVDRARGRVQDRDDVPVLHADGDPAAVRVPNEATPRRAGLARASSAGARRHPRRAAIARGSRAASAAFAPGFRAAQPPQATARAVPIGRPRPTIASSALELSWPSAALAVATSSYSPARTARGSRTYDRPPATCAVVVTTRRP
jgi:hypothetical protein